MTPGDRRTADGGLCEECARWEERARWAEAEAAATRWELILSRETSHALRRQLEQVLDHPLGRLARRARAGGRR